MKFIYLDWNIFVYLIDGKYPKLRSALEDARKNGFFLVFTDSHVEEATNIRNRKEKMQRLQYLSDISDDYYFECSILDFGIVQRKPHEVYETINSVLLPKDLLRGLGNIISRPMMMAFRRIFGLEPSKLNNTDPSDVWSIIDNTLLDSRYAGSLPDSFRDSPIKGFMRQGEENAIRYFSESNQIMGAAPDRAAGPDSKVAQLYMLLEMFGYYPDKKKVFEKGSRFNDSRHCFYSLWSEVCISRDKGFRKKSEAIASLIGSDTKYVSPENADRYIREMF